MIRASMCAVSKISFFTSIHVNNRCISVHHGQNDKRNHKMNEIKTTRQNCTRSHGGKIQHVFRSPVSPKTERQIGNLEESNTYQQYKIMSRSSRSYIALHDTKIRSVPVGYRVIFTVKCIRIFSVSHREYGRHVFFLPEEPAQGIVG